MSLALTNENIASSNPWMLAKRGAPTQRNRPAHPRIAERWNRFLWNQVNKLTPTATLPTTITPPEDHATRFIDMMERAIIGALVSLWALAGWALLQGVRAIFF
ncbi:MAG: hypothetical protein HQM03_10245 [Magnetococcales bacterium]|nr:hypothetical protein [Magnetococcales bacterium]